MTSIALSNYGNYGMTQVRTHAVVVDRRPSRTSRTSRTSPAIRTRSLDDSIAAYVATKIALVGGAMGLAAFAGMIIGRI